MIPFVTIVFLSYKEDATFICKSLIGSLCELFLCFLYGFHFLPSLCRSFLSSLFTGFCPEESAYSALQASRLKSIMGLSTYPTPTDAGVLCVILVNTAISISIVKEIVRSILHVIGIRIASWEEYTVEGPLDTFECRGAPSESYMEEFRSRTPAIPYDSICCISKHLEQECSVCLSEFAPDAVVNQLSCGHVFHTMCLEKWLKYWNVTCPLCRNYLMPLDDDGDTAPM